jgi:hypothetical protein
MRRWVLFVVLLGVVVLTLPLAASAGGWAGSIYDKSECTYTKESNFLFCETTRTFESVRTEQMAFPDATCPSGTKLVSRTGTFLEVWRTFDGFEGHTPHSKNNVFGNDVPLLDQWHWESFTDTDLGCV